MKAARALAETIFWGEEEACISLDAIDGTPVLDIKPVLAELLPRREIRQPAWSQELMRDYWQKKK